MKKALSLFLSLVMVFSTVAIGGSVLTIGASAEETTAYNVGDIIEYGSYPQTKVTDADIISALNEINGVWVSYGYYNGTGTKDDGQMVASDYMRYTDVTYNGNKYRGVTFDTYRPYYTGYGISLSDSYQDNNKYWTNDIYWFKYEPIKWRVLDPDSGLVMCDTVIDSQAYNNYLIYDSTVSTSRYAYFGNESKTYYASDYANSSIRQWLNEDFYNTAFSSGQKSNILTTELNNDGYYTLIGRTGYESLDSASTNDKVFLLSYDEITNSSYGFSASDSAEDSARQIKGSDYAKAQGLYVFSNGYPEWNLRTPSWSSQCTCYVKKAGVIYEENYTYGTDKGVVPALKLQNLKFEAPHEHSYTPSVTTAATGTNEGVMTYTCVCGDSYTEAIPATGETNTYNVGDIIEFGSYPQAKVTDADIISALNNVEGEWVSYGYYSGTGTKDDGQMVASDYMRYKDVTYNGNKYRAVTFDYYRPFYTGYGTASRYSNQDENGYTTGNVYWFKYEPIKWRVLDPDSGLVMCDTIIDSQPYNNYLINDSTVSDSQYAYFGNESQTYYASDYANSSIRQWLNEDFCNTAFSTEQKSNILTTELNNDGHYTLTGTKGYEALDSASTNDKVFLLSYDEITNRSYGFSPSKSTGDSACQIKGSDYAKSQGLGVFSNGCSYWNLRTPGWSSQYSCYVQNTGVIYDDGSTYGTDKGIAPAIKLQELKSEASHEHTYTSSVTTAAACTKEGVMTYTCECGDSYTEAIPATGHTPAEAVKENEVAATATKDGSYDSVVYCSECGEEISREKITIPMFKSGKCGDNLTWVLDNEGTLTISGTGDMYDDASWDSNKANIKVVRIENGVTSIGSYAFYNCTNLTDITIPDSVTRIGEYAFMGTGYEANFENWEDSVLYIDNNLIAANTFYDTEFTIKDGTRVIADGVFRSSYIESITIPASVTGIGYEAFRGSKLTNITIPDSVTKIYGNAFSYCYDLKSVTIGDGVTSIGGYAFNYCSSLESITIGKGVESIGKCAFEGCSALTEVTIPDNVTSIDDYAFDIWSENLVINCSCNSYAKTWAEKNCAQYSVIHSFTNYVSNNDATCKADGTKTAKCDKCDATDVITEEGTKLAHTPAEAVKENEVAATETGDGSYDSVVYCSECGEEISRENIKTDKLCANFVGALVDKTELVRGETVTWTIVTSTDVSWLQLNGSYTTTAGDTKTLVTYYKASNRTSGSNSVTITDNDGVRIWVIIMPLSYTVSDSSITESWNILYKVSGSTEWKYAEVDGKNFEQIVTVAKNAAALKPATEGYAPYTLVSAAADKTEAAVGETVTYTVVVTSDITKVRIGYDYTVDGVAKTKTGTYQTTSTNVKSIVDNGDGTSTWTITYKVPTTASGVSSFNVQTRGEAWGEAKTVNVNVK